MYPHVAIEKSSSPMSPGVFGIDNHQSHGRYLGSHGKAKQELVTMSLGISNKVWTLTTLYLQVETSSEFFFKEAATGE